MHMLRRKDSSVFRVVTFVIQSVSGNAMSQFPATSRFRLAFERGRKSANKGATDWVSPVKGRLMWGRTFSVNCTMFERRGSFLKKEIKFRLESAPGGMVSFKPKVTAVAKGTLDIAECFHKERSHAQVLLPIGSDFLVLTLFLSYREWQESDGQLDDNTDSGLTEGSGSGNSDYEGTVSTSRASTDGLSMRSFNTSFSHDRSSTQAPSIPASRASTRSCSHPTSVEERCTKVNRTEDFHQGNLQPKRRSTHATKGRGEPSEYSAFQEEPIKPVLSSENLRRRSNGVIDAMDHQNRCAGQPARHNSEASSSVTQHTQSLGGTVGRHQHAVVDNPMPSKTHSSSKSRTFDAPKAHPIEQRVRSDPSAESKHAKRFQPYDTTATDCSSVSHQSTLTNGDGLRRSHSAIHPSHMHEPHRPSKPLPGMEEGWLCLVCKYYNLSPTTTACSICLTPRGATGSPQHRTKSHRYDRDDDSRACSPPRDPYRPSGCTPAKEESCWSSRASSCASSVRSYCSTVPTEEDDRSSRCRRVNQPQPKLKTNKNRHWRQRAASERDSDDNDDDDDDDAWDAESHQKMKTAEQWVQECQRKYRAQPMSPGQESSAWSELQQCRNPSSPELSSDESFQSRTFGKKQATVVTFATFEEDDDISSRSSAWSPNQFQRGYPTVSASNARSAIPSAQHHDPPRCRNRSSEQQETIDLRSDCGSPASIVVQRPWSRPLPRRVGRSHSPVEIDYW